MTDYKHFSTFVYRHPSHPYQEVIELFEQKIGLKEILENQHFKEAVYLASASLFDAVYVQQQISPATFKSLLRYFIRFGSRCTPFGLFAGCGTGTIGPEESLAFENDRSRRHTRLDMDFLYELQTDVQNKHQSLLRYNTNTTGYVLNQQFRYLEIKIENNSRQYEVSAIGTNELIESVLQFAKVGRTMAEIIDFLDAEMPLAARKQFVKSLIDNQVLCSEIEPFAIGIQFSDFILGKIQTLGKKSKGLTETIQQIERQLKLIDKQNGIENIESYSLIKEHIGQQNLSFNPNYLFQTDVFFESNQHSISEQTAKNLLEGIDVLSKFSESGNENHRDFKNSFSERYESRMVPLAEVFDEEIGIGFPVKSNFGDTEVSEIIKEIDFKPTSKGTIESEATQIQFWVKKYEEIIRKGEIEIRLEKKDLEPFKSNMENMAPTISAMASIVSLENETCLLMHGASAVTATNLLGRFCFGDKNIHNLTQEIANFEKSFYANCIVAEIAHIPEKRVGNVLNRPSFYDFEIVYLSNSIQPHENRIGIDDLSVCIENDEIVLFSKRHQKRVIPRLSNAHNYTITNLPIYHFLCSIQQQGLTNLQLQPLEYFSSFSFTPRVKYKNIILNAASWQFTGDEVKTLKTFDDFQSFCQHWRMPRFVALVEGDNELPIDLNSQLGYELLIEQAKNPKIQIVEWLHFDKEAQNKFTNQIIIPYYRVKNDSIPQFFDNKLELQTQRSFQLGSEWIYFKLYCGTNHAEEWLSHFFTLIESEKQIIEQWFFIRYADPHNHIRIRIKLTDVSNIGRIIARIHQILDTSTTPHWKIQFDTYERELERYGKENIEMAETLFNIDSSIFAQSIPVLAIDNELKRCILCMKNVDFWLRIFFDSIDERLDFVTKNRDLFATEFQTDADMKKKIGGIYRQFREDIERNLIKKEVDFSTKKLVQIHKKYHKQISKNTLEIKKSKPNEFVSVASSIIHMHVNRWHRSNQRLHEYLIYDILFKIIRTEKRILNL